MSFLCVDIHNLKHYNDIHGLPGGDEKLVEVVAMLRSKFPSNTIYRVGGDEFIVDLGGNAVDTITSPPDITVKYSLVSLVVRKNQPHQLYVNRAILLHIEEGTVKATVDGTDLQFDYSQML